MKRMLILAALVACAACGGSETLFSILSDACRRSRRTSLARKSPYSWCSARCANGGARLPYDAVSCSGPTAGRRRAEKDR